ncbi:class I SAM-dependent methyltransferase [Glutamicibacter creatinolyticus]|uniref:class I SAM-dependent methyltransferase n=1 Tax=Glutamicibacter creatinolyticus TaxID=162496 RepID=UPI0032171428
MKETNYDHFAAAYSTENQGSLLNAYYERPAMLKLAGGVEGHQVLDAGYGSGPLMEELRNRGANVVGFDASAAMIDLARSRLGSAADLSVADLSRPLSYSDDSFDEVMASLVLHYLKDWVAPLREFRRVLRPDGRLIVSVNHPILYPWTRPGQDYFKLTRYSDERTFDGQSAKLTYWHRPLHMMTDAFSEAGFRIEVLSEPGYSPEAPAEIIPPQFKDRTAFLSFIFFVLRPDG